MLKFEYFIQILNNFFDVSFSIIVLYCKHKTLHKRGMCDEVDSKFIFSDVCVVYFFGV